MSENANLSTAMKILSEEAEILRKNMNNSAEASENLLNK